MKRKIKAGQTSFLDYFFARDFSQTTTQAGLTGLTNATASLTWYFHRKGDTASTPVTLVAGTLGTYTSFNPAAPGAPTNVGSSTGGTIPAGTYYTACTWTANGGETAIGTASTSVTLTGTTSSIAVTQPASPPAGVTGWKVYLATSPTGPWHLAGGSPDINNGGVGTAIATTTITAISYSTGNTQPPASTTISGGGIVAVDGTGLAGQYEISTPNPMIASGFTECHASIGGATNMAKTIPFEYELDAVDYEDSVKFGLSSLPGGTAGAQNGIPTLSEIPTVSGIWGYTPRYALADSGDYAYYAEIQFFRNSIAGKDEYTVDWFRNTVPMGSGQVGSPTIQVLKRADGSNLIGQSGMQYISTAIGTTRYDEYTNRIGVGDAYIAVATATVDGSTRTWQKLIGRDG